MVHKAPPTTLHQGWPRPSTPPLCRELLVKTLGPKGHAKHQAHQRWFQYGLRMGADRLFYGWARGVIQRRVGLEMGCGHG